MTLEGLSHFVAMALPPMPPFAGGPLPAAAISSAVLTWGRERVIELPAMVNVAGLREAFRRQTRRVVVHEVAPGVARLVEGTDLHALPGEPPLLLRGPVIVEVRRPDRDVLFGSTIAVGAYESETGLLMVVGLMTDGSALVQPWRPVWGGQELAEGIQEGTPLADPSEWASYDTWLLEALRFLTVFGLLLEAQAAPIRIADGGPKKAAPARRGGSEWSTRRIALVGQAPASRSPGSVNVLSGQVPDSFLVETVAVRGHLKRQRHGAGNALVRWIYVEGYSARRWIAPRLKVVVS